MEILGGIHDFINLGEKGHSFWAIRKMANKSHTTVQYIVNCYKDLENRSRSNRPRKLLCIHRRGSLKEIREKPTTDTPKLAGMLSNLYCVNFVPETLRVVQKSNGLNSCVLRKMPLISKIYKKKHLKCA